MKTGKRKRKWNWMRYRKGATKETVTHNLFCAMQRYVHANKGTAVVMGGPVLIQEGEFRYIMGVRCTGTVPEKPNSNEKTISRSEE